MAALLLFTVGTATWLLVRHHANLRGRAAAAAGSTPAVEAGLLPWQLGAPVSRAVALPGSGSSILIFGGLTVGGGSAGGVYSLDTGSGQLVYVSNLMSPLHDSAGALLGGSYLIFGGGSSAGSASVESFAGAAASAAPGAQPQGAASGGTLGKPSVVGRLPSPLSDAVAVRTGGAVYLVGGFDGRSIAASVLATSDGHTFRRVAVLPVPVRYAAAAAVGGKIYVFGGEGKSGPVDDIQMIDPASGQASVVGHLPTPLTGAMAQAVGGVIYLAGGEAPDQAPGSSREETVTRSPANAATSQPLGIDAPKRKVPGLGGGSPAPIALPQASAPVAGGAEAAAPAARAAAAIWAYLPASGKLLRAGSLIVPVAHAASVVLGNRIWLIGGESGNQPVAAVQMITPNPAFGLAGMPGAGSPYYGGKLLIADRGDNRLLVLDDTGSVVWRYPSATRPQPPGGFYFPDDAFFVRNGSAIMTNQEQNETIDLIAYPTGKLLWSYGHPGRAGSSPGYLHEPDDAFLLPDGRISVADAYNCRVLIINQDHSVYRQIGRTGGCVHSPPLEVGVPNGDTPLANGNLLVSETNGSWISSYTPQGTLAWSVQLPIAYPSDPQQLAADRYLVADYTRPGAIVQFDREGKILSEYRPRSGKAMLDHPSLVERLPSGVFMVNDDFNNRMVAFDPATGALVWQYGGSAASGGATPLLSKPDGFDLLLANGTTPMHL